MPKMTYNKQFRNSICALVFVLVIGAWLIASDIVAQVRYYDLTDDMLTTEAHVTDVSTRTMGSRLMEWTIQVSYTVDGVTYSGELKVETGSFYVDDINAGDTVEIMYNPSDPRVIATELSWKSSCISLIVPTLFFVMGFVALVIMLRRRKNFVITEDEYRREKEARKKRKNKKA